MIYSVAVPGTSILAYCILTRSAIHKVHVSLLGLGLSLMSAALITNVFKNAVGRPRPDLLARCGLSLENAAKTTLTGVEACEATDQHTLQDGWRSFPSGHSSFAFSGLGYLSFFLAGQLHALRGGLNTNSLFTLLCLLPLLGAGMVAVSRLEDYRHGTEDVIVGSALGFLCAWAAYRRFFPTLVKSGCSVPHPSLEADRGLRRDVEVGRDSIGEAVFELDDVDDEDQDRDQGRGSHVPLRNSD
jgi:diacylglycerol diphosphate phosphatase / phosphatidate phosphatase